MRRKAMSNIERTVVAGVSTSDSEPVVRWAAEEAVARRAGLRLVTARPGPAAADRYLPNDVAVEHRAAAQALLAGLAADVAARWPGLTVTTDVLAGPPAAVLRDAAAEAELLVVGADDASAFTEAIRGSVPGDLLPAAPCPLAVVPRREWPGAPASAPDVVALDESTSAQAALAYGYGAAARAGRPLTIQRCVTDTGEAPETHALAACEALYPDVPVTTEMTSGDPRQVLVTASRRAALLVVGSRRRGRVASSLFGSVSRHLIRNGGCPVVVAHTRRAAPSSVALTS
jgi:nucleotide-binding universal stress UspA family protein